MLASHYLPDQPIETVQETRLTPHGGGSDTILTFINVKDNVRRLIKNILPGTATVSARFKK